MYHVDKLCHYYLLHPEVHKYDFNNMLPCVPTITLSNLPFPYTPSHSKW